MKGKRTLRRIAALLLAMITVCSTLLAPAGAASASSAVNKTVMAASSTLKIGSGAYKPPTLNEGGVYSISGKITSNYKLTSVTVGVYYSDGKATDEVVTKKPNAKSYNISAVDAAIEFNKLKAGSYRFIVKATDASGTTKTLVDSAFKVKGKESDLKIGDGAYKPPTLNEGEVYSISGSITSNYKLTSVTVGVYRSDGKATDEVVTKKPNAKSYNISAVDAAIEFNKLKAGSYRFIVKATDESGKTKTLVDNAFKVNAKSNGSTSSADSTVNGLIGAALIGATGQVQYTITYKANGGSGAPKSQTHSKNTCSQLSKTVPTRTGYTFLGWATKSNATKAEYKAGGLYEKNADVTLYAVWQYSGTSSLGTTIKIGNGTYKPPTLTEGGVYSISGNITSSYKLTSVTVGVYHSDGTATDEVVTKKPNAKSYNISAVDAAIEFNKLKAGSYRFIVKATDASGATATLVDNVFKINAKSSGSTSSADSYTITYKANGGSGAPKSQTHAKNTCSQLSKTIPTRTGYTFLGWATKSNATKAEYKVGGSYETNADVTLYAVWQYSGTAAATYTITYNANGGSGAPKSQTHSKNTCSQLSKTAPTRTGYTFLGWATKSNATKAEYKAGGNYEKNADATLYAVWRQTACTEHTYKSASGDYCTECGAQYKPIRTAMNTVLHALHDGTPVRSAPYAKSGYVIKELKQGDDVVIAYSFENALGNLWYETADGGYIYSENLGAQANHIHKAAKNVPDSESTYVYLDTLAHSRTYTTAAEVCSCGYTISGGETVTMRELHQRGGRTGCALCGGLTQTAQETAISPVLYATTTASVGVYSKPGDSRIDPLHTLKQGSLVTIVATQNAGILYEGSILWGKTPNGTWLNLSEAQRSNIALPAKGVYRVTATAPLRNEPDGSAKTQATLQKDTTVTITETFYNDKGNAWGKTSAGLYVYMGNLIYGGGTITVKLNGKTLPLSEAPVNRNGTLLVPIRDIAEALGAHVTWKQNTQTAIIQRGLDSIVIQIGNDKMYADDKAVKLAAEAEIIKGKTFVPLRAISEMFDGTVSWDTATQTASIICDVPSDAELLRDFSSGLFFNFNYYGTFAKEHTGLGQAVLVALGNIDEFFTYTAVNMLKNAATLRRARFDVTAYADLVAPMDGYKRDEIIDAVETTLKAVAAIQKDYIDFTPKVLDDMKLAAKSIKTGTKYAAKNDAFGSFVTELNKKADLFGEVFEYAEFGLDLTEYMLNEYALNLCYLEAIEEALSPMTAAEREAMEKLYAVYESKALGTVDKTLKFLLEKVIDIGVKEGIPLLGEAMAMITLGFDITRINDYTGSVMDAVSLTIISGPLAQSFSTQYYACINRSNTQLNSTVTQEVWDDVVLSFIITKAGFRSIYQAMYEASSGIAKEYVKAQLDVIDSIQIHTSVSSARNGAFYLTGAGA